MPQLQLGLEEEWMEDFEKVSFRDEVKPADLKENAAKLFKLGEGGEQGQ